MNMKILRAIGKRLWQQIPSVKNAKTFIGVGASGDKTYHIDKLAEDIIINGLEESGEPLTIISEEIGTIEIRGGGRKVLIDPIDGSRNAVAGIPFYCTSIAVANGNTIGDIETAYVLNLINGDEFCAEKGKGAFLNGEKIKTQQDDIFYLVAYEARTPKKDITRIMPLLSEAKKTRCLGATALDLSYLASGAVSVFANPSFSRAFDFGGGWLLVKEAGGVFTDIMGNTVDSVEVGLKKTASLLVSGNKRLHDTSLKLLNKTRD
jgi:myo-inositol-1(or 4)-monophosphatase